MSENRKRGWLNVLHWLFILAGIAAILAMVLPPIEMRRASPAIFLNHDSHDPRP